MFTISKHTDFPKIRIEGIKEVILRNKLTSIVAKGQVDTTKQVLGNRSNQHAACNIAAYKNICSLVTMRPSTSMLQVSTILLALQLRSKDFLSSLEFTR